MAAREPSLLVRPARHTDLSALLAADLSGLGAEDGPATVRRFVDDGTGLLALADDQLCGFVVLRHDFFDHGFVALIMVLPAWRRRGIGLRLLAAAQLRCMTPKLFAAARSSNTPAHALFRKAGFSRCGEIEQTVDGATTWVYLRHLV